jgi:ribosomal protein L37AE/L43A
MSAYSTPPLHPAGSGLLRKVVLLILLEIAMALGNYLLVRNSSAVPLLGANLLAIIIFGLVAGLAARILLGQRNWFIRFISATAALIIGLFLLGYLTHWLIGIGPLVFWRKSIDWIGFGKLMIGVFSIVLSMHAWKKPAAVTVTSAGANSITPVPISAQEKTPVSVPAGTPRRSTSTSQARVRAKPKRAKQAHFPLFSPKSKPAARKTAKAAADKQVSKPAAKTRRSLFQHKPQVHLSQIERHLCPYCLEPVTRNDARGVVECDICHTLHHGDCWAIAGSCQVPHYTAA